MPLRGSQQLFGVKITSAPSNYSECKFSQGGFLTFMGSKMPPGGELEFSRHINYDFLKENHKGSFHTKNQKKYSGVQMIQAQKSIFSQKRFFGYKNPLGVPPRGGQLFGVKITSKMKSTPSNYSECKFSAKSNNF